MRNRSGLTLLEVLVTMVVIGISCTVIFRLNAQSWIKTTSVKQLMVAGHAIENAVERKRVHIAANPGAARTPTAAEVPGNFPPPDTVWNDTDHVNRIIVVCSTYVARDKVGETIPNLRMLKARAQILYSEKSSLAGQVKDTVTIYTSISRFF